MQNPSTEQIDAHHIISYKTFLHTNLIQSNLLVYLPTFNKKKNGLKDWKMFTKNL